MARDEALLEQVGPEACPPTMRLYQWEPATVSLGYFQSYAEFASQDPAIRSMPVVRRLTGGGAIIHRNELTYSLALPAGHPWLRDGPTLLYGVIHDAVIALLNARGIRARRAACSDSASARRGPFLCFERRHCFDVVVGPDKVLGSAQRRTAAALLQHGSLQLGRESAALAGPLIETLSQRTGVRFVHAAWDKGSLVRADALRAKYAGADWLRQQ